ncbi:MAG: SCO family protein [Acidobacteriota bacterium]|nr:SCO family protein [Acidobacteriota bacterium]
MSNFSKRWLLCASMIVVGLIAIAAIGLIRLDRSRKFMTARFDASVNVPAADFNQDIDRGTFAGDTSAPDFQLVDQAGRETSLAQYRGKVVLIAFVDSQCTTICPLTTESMVEALRLLGPAAADVQLLGINANPLAVKVSDVAAYTQVHRMQGKWRFLTGSLPQLEKVWRDYHVYVSAINNNIDHQPAMVLIDPLGREHEVYLTQMSYEGVAPQAQILADDIAKLVRGQPAAAQRFALDYVPPLSPNAAPQQMPVANRERSISVGGPDAQLLLFFASWLDQSSHVAAKLRDLDHFAAGARRNGWPSPIAVDELTTEASAASAQKMLAQLSRAIRTPIVEDADGRLGDGYQVQDLPWYSLRSSGGKIIGSHDGWLSSTELRHEVSAALAKSAPRERTEAITRRRP